MNFICHKAVDNGPTMSSPHWMKDQGLDTYVLSLEGAWCSEENFWNFSHSFAYLSESFNKISQ